MIYLRLGVIVVLLLAVVYGLYQCSDTSNTATLTELKTELAQAKASASGGAPAAPAEISGSPATAAQEDELKQVITRAINAYVAQDYGVIAGLADPGTIKSLSPSGQPPMTTAEYARFLSQKPDASTAIAQTLQALINVQDEPPLISADGTRAVYKLKQPIGELTQVVFVKVGATWYLHR